MTTVEARPTFTWGRAVRGIRRRVRHALGTKDIQWARVVMDAETSSYVKSLNFRSMNALEISGTKWANLGFNCYRSIDYPDYDICSGPLEPAGFDIIIAEQVFEHILWPYRAVKNVYTMLKPGGVFVVTTPFLLRIHNCPVDCSRWTPLGLRHLLAEGGFPLESTESHSWGNRACVRSNFRDWRKWTVWLHSLKNEHDFPVVVWAYATKPKSAK